MAQPGDGNERRPRGRPRSLKPPQTQYPLKQQVFECSRRTIPWIGEQVARVFALH